MNKLSQVQASLHARGAKHVQFLFADGLPSFSPTEVKNQAAVLLQAYLDRKMKPLIPVGALTHLSD